MTFLQPYLNLNLNLNLTSTLTLIPNLGTSLGYILKKNYFCTMASKSENIRFDNIHTVIILLIACLGLLSLKNTTLESNSVKKPVPVNISISENNAISTSEMKVQIFQKSWIVNKDNCKLLAFNRNPLSVNRITDIKLSYLDKQRQAFLIQPQSIHRYHLFPPETDDPRC